WDLMGRFAASEPVVVLGGTGGEARDYLHVSDASRLMIDAAEQASPTAPVVNGGTGVSTTVAHAGQLAASLWEARTGRRPIVAFSGVVRSGDPASLIANVSRASSWGFAARERLPGGLGNMIDWALSELDVSTARKRV